MKYSPADIYKYVVEHDLEARFMSSMMTHVGDFTIAEIADCQLKKVGNQVKLVSKMYDLLVPISDDEIVTAVLNGIYVSAFLSRFHDEYQVHFLVHRYPVHMKSQFEEDIAKEVVSYMIKKTILTLRLDSPDKIDQYVHKE